MQVLFAIVGTLILALLVVISTAKQSGWKELAEHYTTSCVECLQWKFVSARIGRNGRSTAYRAALNLGATRAGVYMSVFPLFRIGHPALFIPWRDLSVAVHEGILGQQYEFHFRASPSVFLRIGKGLGEELLKYRTSE